MTRMNDVKEHNVRLTRTRNTRETLLKKPQALQKPVASVAQLRCRCCLATHRCSVLTKQAAHVIF